jgi:transposase
LPARLPDAYRRDDVRLVRRISVRLELLPQTASVTVLCARWGLSPSCLYDWQKAFMLCGMDSLVYRHSGGRPEKWTPRQQKRLVALSAAGPRVVGFATACGNSVLIRVLIGREFGVLVKRHDVGTLLHNLGLSFHKARFVSHHLDAAKRLAWLQDKWPALVRAAKRCTGMLRFADEASVAQWGSFSYTWARRGQQPDVPTSGKRKGSKVCGAMDSCSGRLFLQGIEGRLNSASSHAFLQRILAQTTAPLFLLHDGARSHTSASTTTFLAAHHERLTAHPFPSYAPEDNPIAYLWKKTKQRATHNKYFKEFAALTIAVEKALAYCAMHPEEVLGLFGRYCEESDLELKQAA